MHPKLPQSVDYRSDDTIVCSFMSNDTLLRVGISGSVIAAICCFTPVLVILFGSIGLASLVGILDYVLLPALIIFLALTGYALWKRQTAASS